MAYKRHVFATGIYENDASMHLSGSITENRISVGFPPPVREWFIVQSRRLGMTVPAFIRFEMMRIWMGRTGGDEGKPD